MTLLGSAVWKFMQSLFSRQFQHFRSVFDAGNLRLASEVAGVSQPALSKSIKGLEAHMATTLFVRTSRGVTPTKAGSILNRHLLSMERQSRYAEVEVGGLLKGNGGRILLGAGLVWSKGLVPSTLSLFNQEFPEVRVELSSAISAVLVPMLIEGLIDIAVCEVAKDSLPKEFEIGKTWETARRPWVRREHPLANMESVTWQDLADYGWVGHSEDKNHTEKVVSKFSQVGCAPPQIVMETTSISSMMGIVSGTNLVATFPDQLKLDAEAQGLVRLSLMADEWNMKSAVMYRSELRNIRPFRWLIEELSPRGAFTKDNGR